ncbi:hypothetical protein KU6B_05430 [Mameliella alba]|nr:hypothetical protein KU6B_05430 [Mameliella alba]
MSLPAFSFATATQIRFGRGEAGRAVPDLAARGQRVLLVQGGTPARADWLSAALEAEGCSVDRLSVAAEPDLAMIEAGVTAARASAAQVVIALGGGAVIDAGKAIAALVPATRPCWITWRWSARACRWTPPPCPLPPFRPPPAPAPKSPATR